MKLKTILKIVILLLLLLAALWGWHTLKNPATLPIKHVFVEASYVHVDRKTLADAIAPYMNSGLFNIDVDNLEKQLLDIPWVGSVSVRRIWPDKVVVKIVEQQPIAHWGTKGLLNAQGEVFTPPAGTIPADLALIFNGPDGQGTNMVQYYQQMKTILAPLQLVITQVNLTARDSWSLVLSNNIQVLLGRTDVMQRLQRFVDLYPQLVAPRVEQVTVVDMRYNNGVAIATKH